MMKDSRGYMWFGTSDGLNRYDGYHFKIFEASSNNQNSLNFNAVFSLLEDKKGNIWIGTGGGGINIYNWRTENFSSIRHLPEDEKSLNNDYVQDLLEDQQGRIWAATNNGISILTDGKLPYLWERLYADSTTTNSLLENEVTALEEDQEGKIWIGYSKMGVSVYDPDSKQFTHFQYEKSNPQSLTGNLIKDLLVDQKGKIWVGSHNGITKISMLASRETQITRFPHEQLPGVHAWSLEEDENGHIWAGLYGKGLAKLSDSTVLAFYQNDPQNLQTINGHKISAIYFSDDGQLWIGAETKGLNRADLRQNEALKSAIQHLRRPPPEAAIQSITSLAVDRQDFLWIGTEGDGLEKRDLKFNLLQKWSTNGKYGENLSHVIVTTTLQDRDNDSLFWVGTFGGFNRLEILKNRTRITSYKNELGMTNSLSDNHIFAAYEDNQGYIWLGTRGGGLNRFHKESQSFKRYLHQSDNSNSIPNNYVWNIIADTSGSLWLATDGGLCLFESKKEIFHTYAYHLDNPQSLSSNYLNVLFQDSKGRLWIGTGGAGLNLMIKEKSDNGESVRFERISERNGLINNFIYGILEDDEGYLWISTNQGITRFNPDIPFSHPNYASLAFLHFTKDDGLQDDEFNTNAFTKISDGRLAFGGVNGVNFISPNMIRPNPSPPTIEITEIRILNEEVRAGVPTKTGNIPLSNWGKRSIVLTHKDYVVSFKFSVLNYSSPEKNQYAYMLEGVDPNWIYSANDRQATYTNLSAGNYTFRVKASNKDGVWNDAGTYLKVRVEPAPWLSCWAKLIYFLLGIGVIYGFVRYRMHLRDLEYETQRKIEHAKVQEREALRKRTAADFHDELGNKMTKIGLFVELARRSKAKPEDLNKYLTHIESHTNNLSEGVRDFIWILDPDKDSLLDMLLRLKHFGNKLYEYSNIHFKSEGIREELSSYKLSLSVRRHVMLIFKEAMNNALKYAEAKEVTLIFESRLDEAISWSIILKDNGKGFQIDETLDGYGLSNMRMRAEQIGAKITINSTIDKGTEVKLIMGKLQASSAK